MTDIRPFRIAAGDDELDDLRDRLARTRWPEPETVDDWSQGIPLAYLQELCAYWADGYDWRAREARLNEFPQFRTERRRRSASTSSTCARRTPTRCRWCMTHGWPGSVVEFHEGHRAAHRPDRARRRRRRRVPRRVPVAARLRLQRQADRDRLGRRRASPRRGRELMARLGYDRYGAQGGDWGSMVTTEHRRARPRPRASAST